MRYNKKIYIPVYAFNLYTNMYLLRLTHITSKTNVKYGCEIIIMSPDFYANFFFKAKQ